MQFPSRNHIDKQTALVNIMQALAERQCQASAHPDPGSLTGYDAPTTRRYRIEASPPPVYAQQFHRTRTRLLAPPLPEERRFRHCSARNTTRLAAHHRSQ
jgi:hypothetical protein